MTDYLKAEIIVDALQTISAEIVVEGKEEIELFAGTVTVTFDRVEIVNADGTEVRSKLRYVLNEARINIQAPRGTVEMLPG